MRKSIVSYYINHTPRGKTRYDRTNLDEAKEVINESI